MDEFHTEWTVNFYNPQRNPIYTLVCDKASTLFDQVSETVTFLNRSANGNDHVKFYTINAKVEC